MTTIKMRTLETIYKNHGQQAEVVFKFTMCGEIIKADNTPYTVSGDYEDIQIKSSRATVCKGTDIDKHLNEDKANRYAYVIEDLSTAYIMNKTEWKEFVREFATLTRESQKNGGNEKLRLKRESTTMLQWLRVRVA